MKFDSRDYLNICALTQSCFYLARSDKNQSWLFTYFFAQCSMR